MSNDIIPGFYGKLPQYGDFVGRRLPSGFVKPLDRWLQEAIFNSRQQLGIRFRDCFLAAPVWRFVLGPGSCGKYSAAGILAPSFDKVGRCFPMIIGVVSTRSLSHLLLRATQWFSQVEILVTLMKNKKLDFKKFDDQLQRQTLPAALFADRTQIDADLLSPMNDPLFFRMDMENLHQISNAFDYMTAYLLEQNLDNYSLWYTDRIPKRNSTLSVFRGLPPIDRFVQFL